MTVKLALEHIAKHWKAYAVAMLIVLNIVFAGTAYGMYQAYTDSQHELNQANVVINARISEIQDFDAKLGRAESDLRRQEDLNEAYEKEVKAFQKEIAKQTDKINAKDLKIKSRDETIAGLRGQLQGGNSVVVIVGEGEDGEFETVVDVTEVCGEQKLAYRWSDEHKRFELFDPNIAESGDEEFKYSQLIRIKGLVLTDDTGNVQVKKITAEEVIRTEQDGEVTYETVEGGEVVLVESKFEYTNEPGPKPEFDWLAPITLRPVVGFDIPYMTPSIGLEVANLGRWIPGANVGIVPKLSFDVSGLPTGDYTTLANSRLGILVVYQFIPPLVDTNLGLGLSVSTPMNDLGTLMLSVDLTFYLTQDLFPF